MDQHAPAANTMTLLDLTEPFFQYCCVLNRTCRLGGCEPAVRVRARFLSLMSDMRARGSLDPKLVRQFNRVEPALAAFADWLVLSGGVDVDGSWEQLCRVEPAGTAEEDALFQLVASLLAGDSSEGDMCLAVCFKCLALGYEGLPPVDSDFAAKRLHDCAARLGELIGSGELLCPQAYEHVHGEDLIEPPGANLTGILLATAGFGVVLLAANAYLYIDAWRELARAFGAIIKATGGGDGS